MYIVCCGDIFDGAGRTDKYCGFGCCFIIGDNYYFYRWDKAGSEMKVNHMGDIFITLDLQCYKNITFKIDNDLICDKIKVHKMEVDHERDFRGKDKSS